ncbi:hypothetical protein KAW50_03420 [candidate division WOR-3 bacterium]|nr:hypothetical protein [candidate division WOR-3 bacterium]
MRKEIERLDKKKDILKVRLVNKITRKFGLVKGKEKENFFSKDKFELCSEIMDELHLLERSIILSDRIVRIPVAEDTIRLHYNLSSVYGIKYPREWRALNYLGKIQGVDKGKGKVLKSGDLEIRMGEVKDLIEFSVLKNYKLINQEKLKVYFEFLRRTIKIFRTISDSRNSKAWDCWSSVKRINEYSSYRMLQEIIKNLPMYYKAFLTLKKSTQELEKNYKEFMKDIQDCNQGFKTYLKIKESVH